MAFGTLSSRVLGQIRESLLAAYFDKSITDAWSAAFRIPNLFRRLLGEGALSFSFIPVFVEAKLDSQARAQNLVNSIYTLLLVVVGCLTTWGILYPEVLMQWLLDPSYLQNIEKFNLTLRLVQLMFGYVFLVTSYAFLMGILNSIGQFAIPAMAPTLWNATLIFSTILPSDWFKNHADQLGWGVLIGGVLQVGLLIPFIIQAGFFPKISFRLNSADTMKVLKNLVPGLMGAGLLQFTTLVNLRFSSSLQQGTMSYIHYVDRLIELPLSLISVSLGAALLPTLSEFALQKKMKDLSATTQNYLQINLLFTLASAAGLFVLAEPIVQLLFGRGRFEMADVVATAQILKNYCWIMVFTSAVRILSPAYFAVRNTWFPAWVTAICLGGHILIAPWMMSYGGVHGLMISTVLSSGFNFMILLLYFQKYITEFNYFDFLKKVFIFLGLAVLTGFSAQIYYVIQRILPSDMILPQISLVLNLAFSILFAGFVFLSVSYFLKIETALLLIEKIQRKFQKR